jgi:hypothetical protein
MSFSSKIEELISQRAALLAEVEALRKSAIPPGCVVVKDEPVARMLTWKGPLHVPQQQKIARTYAEFPEDAAFPANKEAYWENAEPLYAARPGECQHKNQKWNITCTSGTCQDCGAALTEAARPGDEHG